MIINEIHIDGFGVFHNLSITKLDKGINILFGENEAGKTTLLNFIRYTLAGYPRQKDQRMSPLSGGSHGGRIKVQLKSGLEAILDRTGDGKTKLTYEGNTLTDETHWLQFVNNTTREFYENVFAFSLSELVNMESLSKSGVADKIYSIGAGLDISISELTRLIKGKTDEIYIPRGSAQRIPKILKDIQEKKNSLTSIQNNFPLYQELSERIAGLETEIHSISEDLKAERIEKEKADNFLKCYENFVSVVNIDRELAELPEVSDYPEEGLKKLNDLEKEKNDLAGKINELLNGSPGKKGIGEIENEIGSVTFNSGITGEKAKVNGLRSNLEKYKLLKETRSENLLSIEKLNRTVTEKLSSIDSRWTLQHIIDFKDILSRRGIVTGFRDKFESFKNEKNLLHGQKNALLAGEGRFNPGNLLFVISVIFLLISAGAFIYSLKAAGIISAVIALIIFFSRWFLLKESPASKLDVQLAGVEDAERKLSETFGAYLENELNLARNLPADTALSILDIIEELKKAILESDNIQLKITQTQDPFINNFEEDVKYLRQLIMKETDNYESDALAIIAEFDLSLEKAEKKKKLEEAIDDLKNELVKSQLSSDKTQESIDELLATINATDSEDFKLKYSVNNRIKDLTVKRGNDIKTIETIAGINQAETVIGYLKTHEKSSLTEDIRKCTENISAMTSGLNLKNTELGERRGKLKSIEGESELALKMTELEVEREKLSIAYKEWVSGKIALKVLTDVTKKYEREKQPVIIQNSGKYFSEITSGRYTRINVSMDKREINIFDSKEAIKNIDQLSRGTREQLLISLRLGFIEEYETRAEPLPIIVDEVLVNFDQARARKTAEIFQEFGKNRQILFFTCHPYVIDHFKKSSVNLIDLKKLVNDTQAI
jgi:uncharacterized protein YhaN